MDEIEVVIKIPKILYAQIQSDAEIMIYSGMRSWKGILATLLRSVRTGTPLPKGHGRLIDADEFKNYCQTGLENVKPLFKTEKYCKLAIDITQGIIADVDEMEPIIEADKGGE